MSETVRVYVNGQGLDVPAGATALDAVRCWNREAASALSAGRGTLTDSRGLPTDVLAPVWGGAIFRLVPARAGGAGGAATDPDPSAARNGRELLRRLPKAELHCHLDGSVRPGTLLDLGAEYGVAMPAADEAGLAAYMRVTDARNLEEYLARFSVTLAVMQRPGALERIAYELAEDVAREGVRYLEVRYAPILNVREGMSLGEAVEAPLRGLERAEREFGVVGRVIVCALRGMDPEMSLEMARLAVAYRKRGVVGFDLAGGELGHPAALHAAAFHHAQQHDVACTCHAGEGDGAESVRQAVHDCGASRLGHATRLIEDEALMDEVGERRIALEICLTSNVQTRATDSYTTHPLREYFDRGLPVVLNTDNRLMSGTTLVDEYEHAAGSLGFTFPELGRIALNGFESAFLPAVEKRALVERARSDIAALEAETA